MKTTKMIFLLLLFCTAFFGSAKAQNLFDINSTWYFSHRESSETPNVGYLYQTVEKDTIINNYSCKKIFRQVFYTNGETEVITPIYFYENDSCIFYLNYEKFQLLYNFKIKTGDSIKIYEPYYTGFNEDSTFYIMIDSIKTEQYNGNNLKTYYFHIKYDESYSWYFGEKYIENIGSTETFLPYNQLDCDLGLCYNPIRCITNNNIGNIFFSNNNCNFIYTSINNFIENVNIYPNPFNNILTINANFKIDKIVVYDIDGKCKYYKDLLNCNKIMLNTNFYNAGIYIISIYFENKIITKKISKN